jgi:multidrug efflux pump
MMIGVIDAALGRARTVILVLALVLIAGTVAYVEIPKESEPDVAIPIIYVSMTHEGISPEDAERALDRRQRVEALARHRAQPSRRSAGNRITSRMLALSVSSITRRSMPMPQPPAGGMPYSSARMKSAS